MSTPPPNQHPPTVVFQFYIDDFARHIPSETTEHGQLCLQFSTTILRQKYNTGIASSKDHWKGLSPIFIFARQDKPLETYIKLRVISVGGKSKVKFSSAFLPLDTVLTSNWTYCVVPLYISRTKLANFLIVGRQLAITLAPNADGIKYVKDLNSGAIKLLRPDGEPSQRPPPQPLANFSTNITVVEADVVKTVLKGSRNGRSGSNPPTPAQPKRSSQPPLLSKPSRVFEELRLDIDPKWMLSVDDIVIQHKIGEGVQGTVLLGTHKGLQVAVKRSRPISEISVGGRKSYVSEINFMMQLDPHPNCVKLIGLYPDEETSQLNLVLEYCQYGSLESYIQKHKQISIHLLMQTLRDVAKGIQHLHKAGIVHRDIAARNILLSSSGAKIADFGLARKITSTDEVNMTGVAPGPLRWMAPEAYGGVFSEATDVHMFGMLMFEVFTGMPPFSDIPMDGVVNFVISGRRPIMPTVCPPDVARLAMGCWDPQANRRPPMEIVSNSLDTWLTKNPLPAPLSSSTDTAVKPTAPVATADTKQVELDSTEDL